MKLISGGWTQNRSFLNKRQVCFNRLDTTPWKTALKGHEEVLWGGIRRRQTLTAWRRRLCSSPRLGRWCRSRVSSQQGKLWREQPLLPAAESCLKCAITEGKVQMKAQGGKTQTSDRLHGKRDRSERICPSKQTLNVKGQQLWRVRISFGDNVDIFLWNLIWIQFSCEHNDLQEQKQASTTFKKAHRLISTSTSIIFGSIAVASGLNYGYL